MIDVAPAPRRRLGRRIVLGILALIVVALLTGVAVVWVRMPARATDLADPPRGPLVVEPGARGEWTVGRFTVTLDSRLRVTHPDAGTAVWETPAREGFLAAARGEPWLVDDGGIVRVSDRLRESWGDQRVDTARVDASGALTLGGTLSSGGERLIRWEVRFSAGAPAVLDVTAAVRGDVDRVYLTAGLEADEGVHGFGAQSAGWDLRGNRLLLAPREAGIGRGAQPVSFAMDAAASAAGGQDTTYFVSGVGVTDRSRSVAYRGDAISSVDLRPDDRLIWEVWAGTANFSVAAASTPIDALVAQSAWAGASAPPPAWASAGLIAGVQGGGAAVRDAIASLQEAGTPLAAVWIQDWTGTRDTDFGTSPQANWTLDRDRYPDWAELVGELSAQGVRILTSVSPWLSADSGAAAAARGDRDLYAEAASLGYLVADEGGGVITSERLGVSSAAIDLSDPAAREWFAQAIAEEAVKLGVSGWLADSGEGPPPDARLQGGLGIDWRVRWPVLWQQVTARALEISGLGADGLVWHRSGATLSAGAAGAVSLGDQTQDWSRQDGLRSVISLTQSLAASGVAEVHDDIGGETTVELPWPLTLWTGGDVARDDELFVRWAEASLFQPVFRTTEGDRPDASAQLGDDSRLTIRIARLARLFAALAPERVRLAEKGPLALAAQHPWMLSPDDRLLAAGSADDELQLGADLLLAPIVEPGSDSISATLPPGRWKHVWSGAVYGNEAGVTQALVSAPLGEPALFARDGSAVAAELAEFVGAERAR